MRKSFLCLCMALAFAIFNTLPVAACWAAPWSFEIYSDDGSKVFVFTPDEYGLGNADAAVYEIINGERRLVYAVEDLSSFAYESNFHFSTDMMHFARIFPPFGMDAFEVFSYGVRTRVVIRSDFIEDFESIQSITSIGPFYTVTWRIEENSTQNAIITINTDEDSSILFDLETARFQWENVLPMQYEIPPAVYLDLPVVIYDNPSDTTPAPNPQAQNSPTVIFVIAGAALVAIAASVFLLKRRKRVG